MKNNIQVKLVLGERRYVTPAAYSLIRQELNKFQIYYFNEFEPYVPWELKSGPCTLTLKDMSMFEKEIKKDSRGYPMDDIRTVQIREFSKPFKAIEVFDKCKISIRGSYMVSFNSKYSKLFGHQYLNFSSEYIHQLIVEESREDVIFYGGNEKKMQRAYLNWYNRITKNKEDMVMVEFIQELDT